MGQLSSRRPARPWRNEQRAAGLMCRRCQWLQQGLQCCVSSHTFWCVPLADQDMQCYCKHKAVIAAISLRIMFQSC